MVLRQPGRAAGAALVAVSLLVMLGAFVAYPILKVVLIAFTDPVTKTVPSLVAFELIFASREVVAALLNTLLVTLGSVAIGLVLGTLLAWLIARTDLPGARYLGFVPVLPLLLPALVGAIGWTALLAPRAGYLNVLLRGVLGIEAASGPLNVFSLTGVTITVGLYLVPYVYALMFAAFRSYDPALDEASRVLGSSIWRTFLRVTLPAVRPGLLGALFLGCLVSIAQFAIPVIVGTPGRVKVLSTLVYDFMHGYPPRTEMAAAISMLLGLAALAGQLAVDRALGRGHHATVGGKASRPGRLPLGRWRVPMAAIAVVYGVIGVVLPLLSCLLLSLSRYWSVDALAPDRLTLDNYRLVLSSAATWRAIGNSAILAILGATIATALGALCAFVSVRRAVPGGKLIALMAGAPAAIPGIVFGVGILTAFIAPPLVLYGTLAILLVAYAGHFLPYALRATEGSIRQVGPELEDAGRVFGSTRLRVLASIVLPLIRPGLAASWGLLAILMLRELPISALIYTPGTTVVSVQLFNLWETGALPPVAAFASLLVAGSLALLAAIRFLGGGRTPAAA